MTTCKWFMFFHQDAQDDIREASEWRVIIDGFDYIVEHLTKGNEQMYWFENIKDNILECKSLILAPVHRVDFKIGVSRNPNLSGTSLQMPK